MILDLFLGFLRVGLFAFGGAYGAIPLIRDVVLSYSWLTEEELTGLIAVSESTPGPIMVNLATYVGSTQAGLIGAAAATFAVVLPSFVIILLVMIALKNALKHPAVQAALRGVKPCIIGIILATGITMTLRQALPFLSADASGQAALFPVRTPILCAALAAVLFLSKPVFGKKIAPIPLIVLAAALGAVVFGI